MLSRVGLITIAIYDQKNLRLNFVGFLAENDDMLAGKSWLRAIINPYNSLERYDDDLQLQKSCNNRRLGETFIYLNDK